MSESSSLKVIEEEVKQITKRPPHPAVSAFISSLDDELKFTGNQGKIKSGRQHSKEKSPVLKKVSQTLGWRNRYSQCEFYPVTLSISNTFSSSTLGQSLSASPITYRIQQVQRGEVENTYGTGATVWPASIVLVKYLEHLSIHNKLVPQNLRGHCTGKSVQAHGKNGEDEVCGRRGLTVADLGAGTGVTSIAAALLLGREASLVVCTDGCDLVVNLAQDNINRVMEELNLKDCSKKSSDKTAFLGGDLTADGNVETSQLRNNSDKKRKTILGGCEIRARKYWWGDGSMERELLTPDKQKEKNEEGRERDIDTFYDVILVSDCVLPKLYPIGPLVDAIDELSGPQTVTYLTYEKRYYPNYDPKKYFSSLAALKGLVTKVIPVSEQHPIYSVEDIEVWEVRRIRPCSHNC